MTKFILGKKIEMTQLFTDKGDSVGVTEVVVQPCVVTQLKTMEQDHYTAVQVGYGQRRAKRVAKPQLGHLKALLKDGKVAQPFAKLHEFRTSQTYQLGDQITVAQFAVGDIVKVSGVSKGKGFQGVVKRYGFHGHPATHGHKDQLRMPGSIGATEPQHVFKGTRMGGHMGSDRVTVTGLEIVKVDSENNTIYLKGAVPGARNSIIEIYD